MKHTRPIQEIKEDIEWWLRKEQVEVYQKSIQSAHTSRLGWLLFSFPELDIKKLQSELSTLAGAPVASRYKAILTDSWNSKVDPKKRLKAVHLECAREDERKVKMVLNKHYSSTSTAFPLGIRMRLVPEFREIKGNQVIVNKVANLRAKQAHFLQAITSVSSDDILSLDVITSGSTKSLRELIMEIKAWTNSSSTLFHAVNESWDGTRVVFTFIPSHAENAELVIQALIPLMIKRHGETVKDLFQPDAVFHKEEWFWDEDGKILDNPQTRIIEGIEGADNDYDFKDIVIVNTPEDIPFTPSTTLSPAARLTATHLDRILAGVETDSVSTMGNPLSNNKTPGSRYTPRAINTSAGDSGSTILSGDLSLASMESRVSSIETKISQMETNIVNSLQSSMDAMLQKLNSNSIQPAGGENFGNDL